MPSVAILLVVGLLVLRSAVAATDCSTCTANEVCVQKVVPADKLVTDSNCAPCAPATSPGGAAQGWWPCITPNNCKCIDPNAKAACSSILTPANFCEGGLIDNPQATNCATAACVKLTDQQCCKTVLYCTLPASGTHNVLARSTCTLGTQVTITANNVLEIVGQKTALLTDLATIEQTKDANGDVHRLFWVEWGELKLKHVRLLGGRVWEMDNDSLRGRRACSGGLVYVGDGVNPNEKGRALLTVITGVIFEGGRAAYGGGISAFGSKSLVSMGSESQVVGNTAYDGGGISLTDGSTLIATKSLVVHKNTARNKGGGMYLYRDSALTTVDLLVSENSAKTDGGGVYLYFGSSFTATGSRVTSNVAGESGGGVYALAPPLLNWTNSVFHANTATGGGGGGAYIIADLDENTKTTNIHIAGSTFSKNLATGTLTSRGGGMSVSNINREDTFSLANTLFDSNTVDAKTASIFYPAQTTDAFQTVGGGIYFGSIATTALNFRAQDVRLVSNVADGRGGGAALFDVNFDVKGTTASAAVSLTNWTVQKNTANTDGGGLALLGTTSVTLMGGTVLKSNLAQSSETKVEGWRAQWYRTATSIPSNAYRASTAADRDEILTKIAYPEITAAPFRPNNFDVHWGKGNNFAAYFSTTLRVTAAGVYTFQLGSDDSSVLKINNVKLCRVEGSGTETGMLLLETGQDYVVEVGYFDLGNQAWLEVKWKLPGTDNFVYVTSDGTAHPLSTSIDSTARGGGLYVSPSSVVHVEGPASIVANTVDGGDGGGVYLDRSQGSTLHHGLLADRLADSPDSPHSPHLLHMEGNTARSRTHRAHLALLKTTIGAGNGGGLFAFQSQIGSVQVPIEFQSANNVPTGIHSSRSSMFLAAPMEQYSDSIVVEEGDFPFPIPQCPGGQWFPANGNDPWKDLIRLNGKVTGVSSVTGVTGVTGVEVCYNCPVGFSTNDVGSTSCSKCSRGEYQAAERGTQCQSCPGGWLQEQEGGTACREADPGAIVLGGTTSIPVPAGNFLETCVGNVCTSFVACPAGWVGYPTPQESCEACPSGQTSSDGAVSCAFCAKGKFSKTKGTVCAKCVEGFYQPKDQEPSTACTECPFGWTTGNKVGESACLNLGYQQPEDCTMEEYLNSTSLDPSQWRCVACPLGASCVGNIEWSGVMAKFGWARCPNNRMKFEQCSFAGACLGGTNFILKDKFPDQCSSAADCKEECNVAYVNGSRLCGQCAGNYSISGGLNGKCDKCLDSSSIFAIAVVGLCFGVLSMFVFIHITISDGGELDESDGAKSIGLSFIQLISLLVTFPIAWPPIFTTIFQIGGSITVLGQNLVNLKCMFPEYTEAHIFYVIRIAWAAAPPILLVLCVLTWQIVDKCRCAGLFRSCSYYLCRKTHSLRAQSTFHDRNDLILRNRVSQLDIKMKTSCVALLYLLWPSLSAQTFSIFACRSICDDEHSFLRADLDEKCWQGRHSAYALGLGLPMLFLYVIGLPVAAFLRLRKLREHAITLPMQRIYGLLYSAFRDNTWWWEGTVAARKIIIALIGVFGASMGSMQVHLTLMLVMLIILMTARVRPFGGLKHGLNHELEIASLMATFLTLWAGSVFNTYPKCQDPSKADGVTLPWCDALSIFAGSVDVIVVIAVVVVFCYLKVESTKEDDDDVGVDKHIRTSSWGDALPVEEPDRHDTVIEMVPQKNAGVEMFKTVAVGSSGSGSESKEAAPSSLQDITVSVSSKSGEPIQITI